MRNDDKRVQPQFSDFVVYVDESGDHGLINLDIHYPIFVLAFCIFQKRYYAEVVVPAVQKFKFDIALRIH